MRELNNWLLIISHICLINAHQSRNFDFTPRFDVKEGENQVPLASTGLEWLPHSKLFLNC